MRGVGHEGGSRRGGGLVAALLCCHCATVDTRLLGTENTLGMQECCVTNMCIHTHIQQGTVSSNIEGYYMYSRVACCKYVHEQLS